MAKFLDPYRNLIDLLTKEGQMLFSNATDKFESPLEGDNKISLYPEGQDYQKMKDSLSRLSQQFRYKYLLNNVATIQVVTPEVLAVAANPTAVPPISAAAAIPESITYTNEIKTLDAYSDQTLEIAQKNASITLGDESFTNQTLKIILNLTQANEQLTTAGRLTNAGKEIISWHILSKILAYQVFDTVQIEGLFRINGPAMRFLGDHCIHPYRNRTPPPINPLAIKAGLNDMFTIAEPLAAQSSMKLFGSPMCLSVRVIGLITQMSGWKMVSRMVHEPTLSRERDERSFGATGSESRDRDKGFSRLDDQLEKT
jgi:hypothetical protein